MHIAAIKLPTNYRDHPVFYPEKLKLKTQPMEQLNDTVHRWLWNGSTGGLVLGKQRAGKTQAIRSLLNDLHTRGKVAVPTYYLSMPSRDKDTIKTVHRQLCRSINATYTDRDGSDHLSERFIHYVMDQASEKQCQHAVLFVDEMQRLTPKQFNAFAEIHDNLMLAEIYLMVIFVGNDQESSHLIEIIEKPEYSHIHGRFFTQGETFRGLTSKDEVEKCLKQYDELTFPENGPTYTNYFLPDAIRQDWKLASLSGDLWHVFREYQKEYKIDSWGMKYFTITVNTLLCDFLPNNGIDKIDDEMIDECMRISGIVPSLVRVNT